MKLYYNERGTIVALCQQLSAKKSADTTFIVPANMQYRDILIASFDASCVSSAARLTNNKQVHLNVEEYRGHRCAIFQKNLIGHILCTIIELLRRLFVENCNFLVRYTAQDVIRSLYRVS